MRDVLDAHTHTIVSGHAYNTMTEMMQAAAEKEAGTACDHRPRLPANARQHPSVLFQQFRYDRPGNITGRNSAAPPRYLIGVELNILPGGDIDLGPKDLAKMDVAIASIHPPCYLCRDADEYTRLSARHGKPLHPYHRSSG